MSGTPIDFQSISHAMSALLNFFLVSFFSNYGPFRKRKKIYMYALQISFTVIKIAYPRLQITVLQIKKVCHILQEKKSGFLELDCWYLSA